jgi:hypothetical protein
MLYLRLTNHNCNVCGVYIEEDGRKENEDVCRVWRQSSIYFYTLNQTEVISLTPHPFYFLGKSPNMH